MAALTTACNFSVMMQALLLHTEHASAAGWQQAALAAGSEAGELHAAAAAGASSSGATAAAASERTLTVRGMWPYWMDGRAGGAVTNDIQLSHMCLLSGPNMAGERCHAYPRPGRACMCTVSVCLHLGQAVCTEFTPCQTQQCFHLALHSGQANRLCCARCAPSHSSATAG